MTTRRIVLALSILTAICALIQISLGANFFVLLMALLIIACGLFGFWLFGAFNVFGMISLSCLCGSLLFAFFAKTLLGQTIDSNLYSASQSFLVLLVYSGILFFAMYCALWINVGKPLQPITDLGSLRFLAYSCFAIGLAASFFHYFLDKGNVEGPQYGFVNGFSFLMFFGIGCATANVMLKTRMRHSLDAVVLVMLVLSTAAGLMESTREYTAIPCIIFFMTVFFFRRRLPWPYVVSLVCGVVIFSLLVPFIIYLKYSGFKKMTFDQEIHALERVVPLVLDGEISLTGGKVPHGIYTYGYLHYFGYSRNQNILGRVAAIQQIDPAIAATDASRPMGKDIIVSGLIPLVPHFIDPNRPDPNAFVILAHQGWTSASHGKLPTLPMAGELYAALGMPGVFLAFPVLLVIMLALKKIGLSLHGNVFGIFVFGCFLFHMFDWNLTQISGIVVRGLPTFYLVIFGLQRLYRLLTQQKRFGRLTRVAHQA